MAIKTYHEAPVSIFDAVQKVTDGDYALCHLLEQNSNYAQCFYEAKVRGREIMLDNSVFELNESVAWRYLDKWTQLLHPDWVIVPDVLNDRSATVQSGIAYLKEFPVPPGVKTVGVVQSSSYTDAVRCYHQLRPIVDMIAFKFDPAWWHLAGASVEEYSANYAAERIKMIARMEFEGVIDKTKPHHLLGCFLPQEFGWYKDIPWMYSLDTSNPVLWGIYRGQYPENGPSIKLKPKMCDIVDMDVPYSTLVDVIDNIQIFKEKWL
jgi:hypothetical protein